MDIVKEEEIFHDHWADSIDINDLCVMEAFEGPVSPEYRYAVEFGQSIEGRKILNIGCGAGEEAVYLTNKGGIVIAADISRKMLSVGKRLSKKFFVNSPIIFKKENAERLSFKDEYFDLVFGNSVLHHVNLEKAIPEIKRVLKNGGEAVFIEPLGYNPVINYYRKMANIVRTPHEHPLFFNDLKIFENNFSKVTTKEFHFFTLLLFCYFFIGEGIHPNKDRYWKKIIREGDKYKLAFSILFILDKIVLTIVPWLRRFCWVTVIKVKK